MTRRTALVTGVSGQDGIYLSHHLLRLGYRVVGAVAPKAIHRNRAYLDGVEVVVNDVTDDVGFRRLLALHQPDEVYNLAGYSSVGGSWLEPELVAEVNGAAVARMVKVLVDHRDKQGADVRFFQAASAEEFGDAPSSPYALAKSRARAATVAARRDHGLFACAATLHSHESPIRDRRFVVRKITRAAAAISLGRADQVVLGSLDIARDWGAAADYVVAMHLMLQMDEPRDLVVASGSTHTLGELLETAFAAVGLTEPMRYVTQHPDLVRPVDSRSMVADTRETERVLEWRAATSFERLIRTMVDIDVRRLESGIEDAPSYLDQSR